MIDMATYRYLIKKKESKYGQWWNHKSYNNKKSAITEAERLQKQNYNISFVVYDKKTGKLVYG